MTLIEDEPGADRVEAILRQATPTITWVSLLEIYYISLQRSGIAEADRRYALAKRLPARFVESFDEPVILTAGRIKARHSVSLADALIAAVAKVEGLSLLHKDPEFESLTDEIELESLPYKSSG